METRIKINNSDELNTLSITTSKSRYSGKLETTVSVCKTDYERGFMTLSFRMFTDFIKTVAASEGRATQKRIKEQHQKAIADIEAIKGLIIAHYAKLGETVSFETIEQ